MISTHEMEHNPERIWIVYTCSNINGVFYAKSCNYSNIQADAWDGYRSSLSDDDVDGFLCLPQPFSWSRSSLSWLICYFQGREVIFGLQFSATRVSDELVPELLVFHFYHFWAIRKHACAGFGASEELPACHEVLQFPYQQCRILFHLDLLRSCHFLMQTNIFLPLSWIAI